MKKILILAYDYPPYISVGGLRPESWYKYLRLYGIHPIVVTRQWNNIKGNSLDYISPGYSNSADRSEDSAGTLIKAPFKPHLGNKLLLKYGESKYRLLRKFLTSYHEFSQFIIPTGNKFDIFTASDNFLKDTKVDCIIATGDPFILFKYASELSKKYSIPWIADYRDAWIQDKSMNNKAYKIWSAFFEKKYLRNVAKVITVSTFIQKQIEQNIKKKEFEIIYNGFDPKILEITKDIEQSDDALTIAFAGTIYDWHPFESFLKVCNELVEEKSELKLRLNFYGINKEDEIKELLAVKYKTLEERVTFYSRVPNLALAKKMARQNVFLLFNDYSILGTKIFDYLAVGRKILLCYENDSEAKILKDKYYSIKEMKSESNSLQADMIKATDSGIIIKNAEHLRKIILSLSEELKEKGFIKCNSKNFGEYSRVNQVRRLAEVVKEVAKN